MEENKKTYIFYTLSLLAVVALGVAIWYGAYLKKTINRSPQVSINLEEALKYVPSVKPAPSGQLPKDWPSDIPLFGKTKITQAQNQVSPGSTAKIEASVIFLSSRTVKDLYTSYISWAKANKWNLKNGSFVDGMGSISLIKNTSSLLFSINPIQSQNQSSVNIYYISQ